jgi:Fe-Mn family superoxide dismutase
MKYTIAPLFCRPWTLNGITPRLIESHYENNYGGALNRLNEIAEELAAVDPAKASAHAVSRLKKEEAATLNSTLLHELYFASLGGDGRMVPEEMSAAIGRDFGSVAGWRDEFIALAGALAEGSGWVFLTYVPRDARLINQTAVDHSQSIAGGIPILALDRIVTVTIEELRMDQGVEPHAAATASCQRAVASARKALSVDREMRWR